MASILQKLVIKVDIEELDEQFDLMEEDFETRLNLVKNTHALECEESYNEILRLKSALKTVDRNYGLEYNRAERLKKELNKILDTATYDPLYVKQLEKDNASHRQSWLNAKEDNVRGSIELEAALADNAAWVIDHNSDQKLIEELREDSKVAQAIQFNKQELIKHLRANGKSLQRDKDNLKDRLVRVSRAL
jgi:hypothetical protein